MWLYENAYVLPLGFMMSEDVIAAWDYEELGDIGSQNELARLLGASEHMLTPVSPPNPGESCFLAEEDGYYYATYDRTSIGAADRGDEQWQKPFLHKGVTRVYVRAWLLYGGHGGNDKK